MELKRYKIGYTTGVFDLFHIGHLNVLMRAKERCDHLIVGVSTDALVREYKGRLPKIPQGQRIEIVRAIRYVDEVIFQHSMDKVQAWETLHFDVMFHGDDWKNTALYSAYEEQFAKVGVDIVYLPHTQGISSTDLRTCDDK